MPFHPTAIDRVRAALKKRGTQAPQVEVTEDRPPSDFTAPVREGWQGLPFGATEGRPLRAGLVLPVPDTLPRSFTLTSPEQSRALSEGFITHLPRRETTFDAGVGSEIAGGFRRIGTKAVRALESGIGEFVPPFGEPFEFPSSRNQLDVLMTQVNIDPSKVRAAAEVDIGIGTFDSAMDLRLAESRGHSFSIRDFTRQDKETEAEWMKRKEVIQTTLAARKILRLARKARDQYDQPSGPGEAIGSFLGDLLTLGQGLPEMEKREFVETLMMFGPVGVMAGPAAGFAAGAAGSFGKTALRSILTGTGRGAGKFGFGRGPAISREGLAEVFATTKGEVRGLGPATTRVDPAAPVTVLGGRSERSRVLAGGAPDAEKLAPLVETALGKAWQFRRIDRPGSIARFLENIPVIKHAIKYVRKANFMPEHIQVANVAETGERAMFRGQAYATRFPLMREIDEVFGPGVARGVSPTAYPAPTAARGGAAPTTPVTDVPSARRLPWLFRKKPIDVSHGGKANVRFLGGTDDVVGIEGTMLDMAMRPRLYDLTDAQKAFMARWQKRNQKLLKDVQEGYGVRIGEFATPPGGVFLPNLDVADDVLEVLDMTRSVAARRGRAKTRVFDTAADRMKFDKTFVPETDIWILQAGMDEAKASMVGREVFQGGAGGKTLTEVIDLLHPTLRKARDDMAKKVASLEGKIARAEAASTTASRAAKRAEKRMTKMDRTSVLLLDTIEELGDELGPEFTRIVNQIKSLQKRSEVLQSKVLHLRDVAALKGIKRNGLMPELQDAVVRLEKLRLSYQGVNLPGYTFVKEDIFRYFPAAEAKAVRELRHTSSNQLVMLLEAIRGTAFGGDASPILGVQLPLFALFHPVTAIRRLIGAGKNSRQSRDLLHAFREDTVVKAILDDPQTFADLAFFTGRDISIKTPGGGKRWKIGRLTLPIGRVARDEFAGGLLGLIPGYTRANDSLYAVVMRQMAQSYKKQLRILAEAGLTGDAAKVVAADMATSVIPLWNPSRLGLSPARAAAIRSIPTSISFLIRPATLLATATTGFAKMALRIERTPQEMLAIRLMLTYTASTQFLSITSAVTSALVRGTDPWEAAERAANPLSPIYGDLIIGTRRLPLGGPYRGIIRTIIPRKVDWSPVPVPFGNFGDFARNRIGPGLQLPWRLIENRDYQKGKIRKGHMPEQILRSLLYTVEGIAPLTAGSAISGVRRELEVGDIVEEAGAQFAGTNLIKETPFQERNVVATQWAKEQGLEYKVESYSDLSSGSTDHVLGDQARFEAAHPDEVAAIKKEQERQVKQGIPRAVAFGHLENVTTIRIDEEEALVKELQLPVNDPRHLTLDEFRAQYSRIQAKAANGRAVLDPAFDLFKDTNELPDDPNKRALVQYYNAFDDATSESGKLIFELLDANLAELESHQWTDEQNQWVKENTGWQRFTDRPPLIQEYLRDRDREDVKEWQMKIRKVMEEMGHLTLYRQYLEHDPGSSGQTAFKEKYPSLDDMLLLAQDQKDKMRSANTYDAFILERILYKWGYIDTPLNSTLESEVWRLQQEQGGVVTDRLAIDREPAGVAP